MPRLEQEEEGEDEGEDVEEAVEDAIEEEEEEEEEVEMVEETDEEVVEKTVREAVKKTEAVETVEETEEEAEEANEEQQDDFTQLDQPQPHLGFTLRSTRKNSKQGRHANEEVAEEEVAEEEEEADEEAEEEDKDATQLDGLSISQQPQSARDDCDTPPKSYLDIEAQRRENMRANAQKMRELLGDHLIMKPQTKPKKTRKRPDIEGNLVDTPRRSARKANNGKFLGPVEVDWRELFQSGCVKAGEGVVAVYPRCISKDGLPVKTEPNAEGQKIDVAYLGTVDESGQFSLFCHSDYRQPHGADEKFATPKDFGNFCYQFVRGGEIAGDGFQHVFYGGKSLEEWRADLKAHRASKVS